MTPQFYIHNRQVLARDAAAPVLVLAGHEALQKAADTAYDFQQETNFRYLTGIHEAGWKLVIEQGESTLIAPQYDDMYRVFNGGLSQEEAQRLSGVQRVVSKREGDALLRRLAAAYSRVGTLGRDPYTSRCEFWLNPGPVKLQARLKQLFKEVEDIRPQLMKRRAIKQSAELVAMRAAIDLTARSFEQVKAALPRFTNERQVAAQFTYDFMADGGAHAYEPIVAAGKNACTLHYIENNTALPAGSSAGALLLMDVGASLQGYAADITRTYQCGGAATARQRAVHAAVRRAQAAIIGLIKPGVSLESYQQQSDAIMKTALASLGLLRTAKDYRTYFPHAISHGLGSDVHEPLGGFTSFQPGMVLTVEPGIYIPEEAIGVRIEDDILVTTDGRENLSAALSTDL